MKRLLLTGLLIALVTAGAFSFPKGEYRDQWGKKHTIAEDDVFILYSAEKDVSVEFHKGLEKKGEQWLNENHIVYMADVTSVPGFVMKRFMLPKMKKYSYPVLLIREDEQLPRISTQKGKATLHEKNGKEFFLENFSELEKFLSSRE